MGKIGSTTRVFFVSLVCHLAMALSGVTFGQTDETERSPYNYAFATQLGSGIYEVDGRTVQIYRLTGALRLREMDDGKWGVLLRVPITFGFHNFKSSDILDIGLPEQLGTLALVPAIEFEYAVKKDWILTPYLGAGAGKDFSGGSFNFIYAIGVRSLAMFRGRGNTVRLGNRLVYTGYSNRDMEFVDDFAFFETGVDLRRGMGTKLGGLELDGGLFAMNYIYFISPHIVRMNPEAIEMRTEWELGMTFGTVEPWKIFGVRMPRIGLSYRFGTGVDALRFIIGNPFQMSSPNERGPGVE